MSEGRLKLIVRRARGSHGLHKYTAKAHPGQRAYPDWYAWTHIRGYLCTLTGGCAWGPLHPHWSGEGRSCWKCQSTWSNPRETQNDRPWRSLHPRLYWLDALMRRRRARRSDRIRERVSRQPGSRRRIAPNSRVLWVARRAKFASRRARLRAAWHYLVRRHRYEICNRCGRPVGPHTGSWWSAPDALWYRVIGDRGGTVCPPCFTRAADAKGIAVRWVATWDDTGPSPAEHREETG